MAIRIIDEKQTGNYRLLILDDEPYKKIGDKVTIGNNIFERLALYDLKCALAIVCNENTPSLIGSDVKV